MDTSIYTGDWDHADLPPNVRVGSDCFLEDRKSFRRYFSERDPGLVLGDRVLVYTWSNFSIEPSGFVEIGDDCVLVGAQFMCGERISLGRRVVVSYNVAIADCDFHPLDPEERRRDAIANAPRSVLPGAPAQRRPPLKTAPVEIEDDAWIGIGAIILKGVRIGAGGRVAAGAVVTTDVPAGATAQGNPARIVDPVRR
jgi:acetyltransferase-like isoleucine patch superfamily enzyme